MHEDDLQILLGVEAATTGHDPSLDLLGSLDDVRKSFVIPPHTATASRRTRFLIRTFSPPTVAT